VALFAPFAGNFDADLGRQGLALGAAAFASAALLLFSEKRQLEAFVAASAFLLAAGGGAVLPEVEKRQGYHGFAQDVLKTGVERGEIALTPGGLHREHLCWELAPVTTGARLLLAADLKSDIPDRSTVLSYLRERPPRKRAVILRKEHLRIFDAALKQDIELVADSEPDELGGLVAIERKE